jgi:hypothetical protein
MGKKLTGTSIGLTIRNRHLSAGVFEKQIVCWINSSCVNPRERCKSRKIALSLRWIAAPSSVRPETEK